MKSRILLFIITICSLTLSTAQQQPLKINTSTSQIKWIGEYTFYFGGHDGTIDFKEGYFLKMGDVITGGEFIIDMTSIKCLDIESQEGKDNLVNHLKDLIHHTHLQSFHILLQSDFLMKYLQHLFLYVQTAHIRHTLFSLKISQPCLDLLIVL